MRKMIMFAGILLSGLMPVHGDIPNPDFEDGSPVNGSPIPTGWASAGDIFEIGNNIGYAAMHGSFCCTTFAQPLTLMGTAISTSFTLPNNPVVISFATSTQTPPQRVQILKSSDNSVLSQIYVPYANFGYNCAVACNLPNETVKILCEDASTGDYLMVDDLKMQNAANLIDDFNTAGAFNPLKWAQADANWSIRTMFTGPNNPFPGEADSALEGATCAASSDTGTGILK